MKKHKVLILIIMCLIKMVLIHVPSLIVLTSIQAVTYWITGISIYNKIKSLMLRGM